MDDSQSLCKRRCSDLRPIIRINTHIISRRGNVGAAPDEARAEVLALLDEVRDARGGNVLTVAAYFHAVLESIHPFADGNGRLRRELMNYLLLLGNHPPVIIFEGDRMAYYGAVEAWDAERNLDPLRDFLKVEAVRTWEKV